MKIGRKHEKEESIDQVWSRLARAVYGLFACFNHWDNYEELIERHMGKKKKIDKKSDTYKQFEEALGFFRYKKGISEQEKDLMFDMLALINNGQNIRADKKLNLIKEVLKKYLQFRLDEKIFWKVPSSF